MGADRHLCGELSAVSDARAVILYIIIIIIIIAIIIILYYIGVLFWDKIHCAQCGKSAQKAKCHVRRQEIAKKKLYKL